MSNHAPDTRIHDLIGVGFGPSNLALAICLEELANESGHKLDALFLEKQSKYAWHGDTIVDQSTLQISFLKDLVSLRNPTSPYSFVNYLHRHGRLVDFINLSTFYPSRLEFDDYLRWVAGHFGKHAVYGEEVLRIEPVRNGREVDRLRIVSRNGGEERTRVTRALVIASGGRPRIPAAFQGLKSDPRVFHHAHYLSSVARLPCAQAKPMQIAVVGGGQSAAEAFLDLNDSFPCVKVDLIQRASALKPADSSPFVNEVFAPAYIDQMFRESADQQRQLNAEFQNTNYAVADIELIERIYGIFYHQKVIGQARHTLMCRTEIERASASPNGITLTLRDRAAQRVVERRYDAVILATGYDRHSHRELLAPLEEYCGTFRTNRNYRVEAEANLTAPIYLQGFSEATHGLSETLLSVLPIRSEKIGRALHELFGNAPQAVVGELKRARPSKGAANESSV